MSFLGGALSGYAKESGDMRTNGKRGLLRRKKKADMPSREDRTAIASMRKGGRVKKTGLYRLHKGEKVVPTRGRSKRR